MKKTLLIRYSSEVGIRRNSSSRHLLVRVQKRIRQNLKSRKISFDMEIGHGHIILHTQDWEKTYGLLKRVFGVGAFYPCIVSLDHSNEDTDTAVKEIAPFLKGKTFRIRCNKVDRGHLSRMDVEKKWGAIFFPYAEGVSLKAPDVNVRIEILRGKTYFFLDKVLGPGGMGFSLSERVLVLASGGFDSAVAAWKMMKKGIPCDYLFCNMGGKTYERMALQVVKVLNDLWAEQTKSVFFSLDFNGIVGEIKKVTENPYRQIILKRAMFQAASRLACERGYEGIVTGESIGQVSSQTLRNISVIQEASCVPIFRPVLNDDRPDIIALACEVGTGRLSEKVTELCGISQGQPVAKAKIQRVLQEEKKLPSDFLVSLMNSLQQKSLDSLKGEDLRRPYLFVDSLDEDAEIIDCQEEHLYRSWHISHAKHIKGDDLLNNKSLLEKGKKYILYCTYGTQTPYLTEILQLAGYDAYCFRGGVKHVKKSISK